MFSIDAVPWFPFLGTREAAFVHAISAAGVSHAVTVGCSTGTMEQCGCDRTVKGTSSEGFEWSGCSHNVAYGNAFSEMFVDARERTKGRGAYRALMNLHNNKAGRKVIRQLINRLFTPILPWWELNNQGKVLFLKFSKERWTKHKSVIRSYTVEYV